MDRITTQELDQIARLGLDDLRECFGIGATPEKRERAEMALRLLSQSTRRMSSETNRLAVAFKVAKSIGLADTEVIDPHEYPIFGLRSTGRRTGGRLMPISIRAYKLRWKRYCTECKQWFIAKRSDARRCLPCRIRLAPSLKDNSTEQRHHSKFLRLFRGPDDKRLG